MFSKFINYVIWTALVAAILGVAWFLIQPFVTFSGLVSEWTFYVRLFIVLFAIQTFATLRLYNSIVQNTRFAIKLREALLKFNQALPALERSLKNLNSSMGNIKSVVENARKDIKDNTEEVQELSNKLRKSYNKKQ